MIDAYYELVHTSIHSRIISSDRLPTLTNTFTHGDTAMSIHVELNQEKFTPKSSGSDANFQSASQLSSGDNQLLLSARDSSATQSSANEIFGQLQLVDDHSAKPEPAKQPVEIAQVKDANDVAARARQAYIDWGSGALGLEAAERVLNGEGPQNPDQSSEDRTRNANAWNNYDGGARGMCLPNRNGTSAEMVSITAGKINGRIELSDGGDCN